MIKLNKQVEMLERIQDKVQAKIDELQEKMDAIEEAAGDEDRDLTVAEQNRYDRYEAEIEELDDEYTDICNAIDYLREYCD